MINREPNAPLERRHQIGFTDLRAAIRHDVAIATKEGFPNVARRAQEALDWFHDADALTRDGQYLLHKVEIVFTFVPAEITD